jgi:surface antigen
MIAMMRRGKRLFSFRVETGVTLGVIIVLLLLPAAAVASITNIDDMLSNGITPGDSGNGIFYTGDSPEENTYAWGNCTYWVFIKRKEAGNPIPNTWHNAADWELNALLQGYKIDKTPAVGAIMQTANSAGGLGHVAYVTKVDSITGSWTVSEMNVKGLNVVSERTFTALDAHRYNFIHDRGSSDRD